MKFSASRPLSMACVLAVFLGASEVREIAAQVYPVTNYGVKPDDGVDDEAALAALIAMVPSGSTLSFAAGTYDFFGTGTAAHVDVSGLAKLVFQGDPSNRPVLLFHNRDLRGLWVRDSAKITFENFVLDYTAPFFAQGAIQALGVDANNRSYMEIDLDPGYPNPVTDVLLNTHAHAVVAHHPVNRRIRERTDQFYLDENEPAAQRITDQGNGIFRVLFKSNYNWANTNIAVGDLYTLKANNQIPIVYATHNEELTLRDVRIHSSGSAAVIDVDGTSNAYEDVWIEPKADELLSSNRDGLYLVHQRHGPTVRDCRMVRTGDDAIAIRSSFVRVFFLDPIMYPNWVAFDGILPVQPGDTFEFYDQTTFATSATATVVSSVIIGGVVAVEFTAPPPTVLGERAVNLDIHGNGFLVEGNVIRHHRARGMLIKASDGVIRHNDVHGSTMGGILLGPEIGVWNESGFVRNVEVHENVIREVASRHPSAPLGGGIAVYALFPTDGSTPTIETAHWQNREIHIHDNLIDGAGVCGVILENLDGGSVTNNRIVNCQWNPFSASNGAIYGLDTPVDAIIHVQKCQDVTITGNEIETTSGHGGYHVSSSSVNVTTSGNTRVFHTNFEEDGHPGWPSTASYPYHNVHTASWTHAEDGVPFTMAQWGLFGNHTQYPYYIGRQTSRTQYDQATLELEVVDPTKVEFAVGSNGLLNTWTLDVEIEPLGSGMPNALGTFANTAADLDASAPVPYFTTKQIPLTVGPGTYVLRFRRSSSGAPASPYVYLDDLLVGHGALP